jgi:Predicted permease
MIDAVGQALGMAFAMGWEILWPLVPGFALSAAIQAIVSHQEMSRLLPDDSPRSIGIALALGAASSSCSYAAVAIARSIFRKGANFTAAMAFEMALPYHDNVVAQPEQRVQQRSRVRRRSKIGHPFAHRFGRDRGQRVNARPIRSCFRRIDFPYSVWVKPIMSADSERNRPSFRFQIAPHSEMISPPISM